ncbi:MAG: VanZ family protein [Candidatus Altiarchaeota archaeon]|nr:VanZ family protein [Candidatus Altiarchaeota archaeon]
MNALSLLSRRPGLKWVLVLLYALTIFLVSSVPGSSMPSTPVSSTVLHVIEYFGFGFILFPAVKSSFNGKHYAVSLLLIAVYAASDEFHQSFVPGRAMSFMDWLADFVGGAVGIFLSGKTLNLRE